MNSDPKNPSVSASDNFKMSDFAPPPQGNRRQRRAQKAAQKKAFEIIVKHIKRSTKSLAAMKPDVDNGETSPVEVG